MDKRERIEKTIAGEKADRVAVSMWRHWPNDDQKAEWLAASLIDFQQRWDWDFVKVSPADSYPLNDYGTADEWTGTVEGVRKYVQRAVVAPEDWRNLRTLDPTAGSLGEQLRTLDLLREGLPADTPAIQTVFSPLAQAKNIVGPDEVTRHMRQYPDEFRAGLETITENTLRYIDAMRNKGLAGIYYAVQLATYYDMSEDEYREFGRPYDLRILEALPESWWFNMMHIHSLAPMFDLLADYPVQAVNWHDRESEPSLAQGMTKISGAVSGGLGAWDAMNTGTPDAVRDQALDAIEQTGGQRLVLSTGCVMMTTTPVANIRTVRELVENL